MTTLLAFLFVNPERIAALVMNFLAVGGGFMVGYIVTTVTAFFLDRWLTRGRSPEGLHKTVRMVGGVCGAILVALLVFGSGSGGTSDGPGKGDGTTEKTGSSGNPTTVSTEAKPITPPTVPETKAIDDTMKITVLSGADVKDEKFYLIEKDRTPRSLEEVKTAVVSRKTSSTKSLAVEILLNPRTDRNNSGVLDLESWARDAGMRVILPKKE